MPQLHASYDMMTGGSKGGGGASELQLEGSRFERPTKHRMEGKRGGGRKGGVGEKAPSHRCWRFLRRQEGELKFRIDGIF